MQRPIRKAEQKSVQSRISNVKKQLEKLSSLISNDKRFHDCAIKALLQCELSSSSGADSNNNIPQTITNSYKMQKQISCQKEHFNCEEDLLYEKYFNFQNSLDIENDSIPNPTIHHVPYNRPFPSQQSHYSTNDQAQYQTHLQSKQMDTTIKKGKPAKNSYSSVKKKDDSQISSNKGISKLKNVKSEKRLLHKKILETSAKNQNKFSCKKLPYAMCKISVKQKKNRAQNGILTSAKNRVTNAQYQSIVAKPFPLTSCSGARGLSSKYHLNLKKQVSMKINDLKLKKLLCQKQSEYLSAAIRINKQEIQTQISHTKKFTQQSYLKIFILKSIVRFFTQFIEDMDNDDQFDQNFIRAIENPSQLIKFIMKLPDILKSKSTLSQERCHQFFQQFGFIEEKLRKINSEIVNKGDIFNTYLVQLHHYIDFLLDNEMIHRTKRRNIFTLDMQQFFSDRSTKEKKSKNTTGVLRQKKKDYDTERKLEINNLKRTNTAKVLSPKIKRKKEK